MTKLSSLSNPWAKNAT